MCQLLETIKCRDGILFNLEFHNLRLNKARHEKFGIEEKIDLKNRIEIPENCKTGLFRCRVIYAKEIESVEFIPHQIRKISSLKLVENNSIDYHLKYVDRKILQQLFELRGNCDDILIVKNGCITDSSTANVIFFDGQNWWTPDSPLLVGTQRARLLSEGKITPCKITVNNISNYKMVGLINAFQDFDEMPIIKTERIFQ